MRRQAGLTKAEVRVMIKVMENGYLESVTRLSKAERDLLLSGVQKLCHLIDRDDLFRRGGER